MSLLLLWFWVCLLLSTICLVKAQDDEWGKPTDSRYKRWPALDLTKKLRVAVIVVDNRELEEDLTADTSYSSLTAVLNYEYAKRHNYHFYYYHPTLNMTETKRKYPNAPDPLIEIRKVEPDLENVTDWHDVDKRLWPTAFHPLLNRFRGATWSKVAIFWHASTTMASMYDLIFYLDSDAAVTSKRSDMRVEEMMLQWHKNKNVTWGVRDLTRTAIIFFPNTPFGDRELATGSLIFRPKLAAPLFKEWWDNGDSPVYDFTFAHEQSVIIDTIFAEPDVKQQKRYNISFNTVTMVSEPQFPSFGYSPEEWCFLHGWICHICSFWSEARHHIFRKMLGMEMSDIMRGHTPRLIAAGYKAATMVLKEDEIQFNVLAASEAMTIATS